MITNFKLFESKLTPSVGDYFGYKRYLGLSPIIVKILSIIGENQNRNRKQYFVELLEEPHTTYVLDSWELEELDDDGKIELEVYLNSEKYNI